MIVCRTKGDTAPGQKPKFYIISHPADFNECMESAINILFYDNNPAIYYNDDCSEDYLCNTTDTYQLIVVLATKSLMTDSSSVARSELDYAIRHSMPILPFTFEPDDAEIFSSIIGHYHCMYTGEQDIYAKNFFKKLNDFINKTIGKAHDREEIMANAFDMKMFISYRQSDRACVNEYVRKLHSHPDLMGIGYWYDEDLIYGDDFDDEIDAALSNQSSDLFLLIVTPNLLQANNYVKEEEYKRVTSPQYSGYGKPIVAIEMIPTNHEAFMQMYPDVQYFFEQSEIDASFDCIRSILHNKIGSNIRDPFKTTMLGKAYLYGVGTELNYKLGANIISPLAEEGYIPAINMMIEIYSQRLGVNPDSEALLYWRYKCIERCRDSFEDSGKIQDLHEYLTSLYLYGSDIYVCPKMAVKERLDISEKILLKYDYLCHEYGIATEDYFDVLYTLGNINYIRNSYDKAASYYYKQIDATKHYVEETGFVGQKAARAYFVSLIKLADIECAQGNIAGAEEKFADALDVASQNMAEFPCNETLRDLCSAHSRIGDLYMKYGQKSGQLELIPLAKEHLIMAANYRHQAYKEIMSFANLVNLIQEFINAGQICYISGDLVSARQYYNKSTHAFQKMHSGYLTHMPLAQIIKNYAPNILDVLQNLVTINAELGRKNEAYEVKEILDSFIEELKNSRE